MASTQNCNPLLSTNPWCLSTLSNYVGENNDLILIDPLEWAKFKTYNMTNLVSAPAADTVLKYLTTSEFVPKFSYDQPVTTPSTIAGISDSLFPDGAVTSGMYFFGNVKMFNPQIGTAQDANGVPYQMSTVNIQFGSQPYSVDTIAYIQSRKWVALRLSASTPELFVYGGPSGMSCKNDDVIQLMFSGNNDASGVAGMDLEQKKSGYALEIIQQGILTTTPSDALQILYQAIKLKCCMTNTGV